MAAGEYVSVYSQADTETADLEREHQEIIADADAEQRELTAIYVARGLDGKLASQVAQQLMAHDALGAHARDELGLAEQRLARPLQAAWASALSFAVGASVPLIAVALTPAGVRILVCVAVTLLALALLGDLGARLGGAPPHRATVRALVWGTVAMAITSGIGALIGTTV